MKEGRQVEKGLQIGTKFRENGMPERYPGVTVITNVEKDNPAYPVIHSVYRKLDTEDAEKTFIFLPEDSYHITVIRGFNYFVREDEFWPAGLNKDVTMADADTYFAEKVSPIRYPRDRIHMKFESLKIDESDVRICVKPFDEAEERCLSDYRDRVADAVRLKLPGHDSYVFHVTVAYIRYVPEGKMKQALSDKVTAVNEYLKRQEPFFVSPPAVAYYDDMLHFSFQKIKRKL